MTEVVVTQGNNTSVIAPTTLNQVVVDDKKVTVITTGMMGPAVVSSITNSADIDISNLQGGSTLVYNSSTQQWTATKLLDQQIIESGQF